MQTSLFNIGDVVKIRPDIKEGYYNMRTNDNKIDYLVNKMAPPNSLVQIAAFIINEESKVIGYLMEEPYDFYTYSDDMFDQDTVNYMWNSIKGEW